MKHYIIIIIVLISLSSNATETISLNFNQSNLNLSVGYNEGNIFNGDKIAWYYKGVSEQLNSYIKELVEEGKLKNKKFNISFWLFPVSIYEACPIELSQNENGYFISVIEKQLRLIELVEIINYFASDKWESFICKEPKKHQKVAY